MPRVAMISVLLRGGPYHGTTIQVGTGSEWVPDIDGRIRIPVPGRTPLVYSPVLNPDGSVAQVAQDGEWHQVFLLAE